MGNFRDYRFKDRVKITIGFYKNCVGTLIDSDGKEMFYVRLDDDSAKIITISGVYLEKINEQ